MSLTTVVITYNEAKRIQTCLESVNSFSDEIIVVDSFSNDETLEIVSKFPKSKVYSREFDNYINQKNYANQLVQTDFILSMDADEWCSEELSEYLMTFDDMEIDAMSFLRVNYYFGKAVHYGLRGPEKKIRLWKRGKAYWGGTTPHEDLIVDSKGTIIESQLIFNHLAHQTYKGCIQKSLYYSRLAAVELSKKSYSKLISKLIFNPFIKFFKDFVLKKGFLEGFTGLFLASVSWLETLVKYYTAIKIKWNLKIQ